MNRTICVAAFAVGLGTVGWIGAGYVGASPLGLAMTAIIGAVYLVGAAELLRFHRTTTAFMEALVALREPPAHAAEWVDRLPPSLRNPVRLRIEGERIGLPGPAVTPYLVGLLVLLGMLGTFLGMVVTLNGAVVALEGTTDLHTIRAALAAPVKGLGVAFGTSVAGVTASAMLGLVSVLCRRERLGASQLLDTKLATVLRGLSLAHQRQETFSAVQQQARLLPVLVDKIEAMMAQMAERSRQSDERQLAEQERFHREATTSYSALAASVDRSLKESLTESARLAGETLQPLVAATMSGIARETTALQARVAEAVAAQLDGIAARFDGSAATVADTWTAALARHERASEDLSRQLQDTLAAHAESFERRSASLLASVESAHAAVQGELASATRGIAQESAALLATVGDTASALQAAQAAQDEARQAALARSLEAMASSLQQEWQQAGAHTLAQQEQLCRTLDETARDIAATARAQASGTLDEVARLMQTAAEAPRAAAEVIAELRRELSASVARDNALLAERSRIMETLGALLDAINHASTEQRSAIDALVASSTAMLERAGERFAEGIEAQSGRMVETAGQLTAGAVEVASLGEAFGVAVQRFGESSDKLMASLQRIEGGLDKAMLRSDEQLAYYVAQAREIIDLSIMSQRQVIEDLQQGSGRQAAIAGEV